MLFSSSLAFCTNDCLVTQISFIIFKVDRHFHPFILCIWLSHVFMLSYINIAIKMFNSCNIVKYISIYLRCLTLTIRNTHTVFIWCGVGGFWKTEMLKSNPSHQIERNEMLFEETETSCAKSLCHFHFRFDSVMLISNLSFECSAAQEKKTHRCHSIESHSNIAQRIIVVVKNNTRKILIYEFW